MGCYKGSARLSGFWEDIVPAVEKLYQVYSTYQTVQSEQRRREMQLEFEKELDRLRKEAEAKAAAEAAAKSRIDWRLLGMVAAMGTGIYLVAKKPLPAKGKKHGRK